jgi:hypothetical protein
MRTLVLLTFTKLTIVTESALGLAFILTILMKVPNKDILVVPDSLLGPGGLIAL